MSILADFEFHFLNVDDNAMTILTGSVGPHRLSGVCELRTIRAELHACLLVCIDIRMKKTYSLATTSKPPLAFIQHTHSAASHTQRNVNTHNKLIAYERRQP